MNQSCGMSILPVLILLAGKMPAPQEILGYFFIWKSLMDNLEAKYHCLLVIIYYWCSFYLGEALETERKKAIVAHLSVKYFIINC
jgi:hypothetical protein